MFCFGCCVEQVHFDDRSSGRYRLFVQSRLTEGGFSTIDLVRDASTRQVYALKRIVCHSSIDEAKALHEAQFHRNLPVHPNILFCAAFGQKSLLNHPQGALSEVLLLLTYHRRGTLQQALEKRILESLPTPSRNSVSVAIITGVCNALKVFLSLNPAMSHRDLKPGNILLQDDWTPVLMDFGSVTTANISLSCSSDLRKWEDFIAENCSMAYRAPELFSLTINTVITEQGDIWSLGCILYAVYFNESPFDRIHARGDSIALAVTSGNLILPKDVDLRIPAPLVSLLRRMLSVDPLSRPTVYEVLDILEGLSQEVLEQSNSTVFFSSQPAACKLPKL